MFHWICPECGREIAPQVLECPVCDPSAEVASSAAETALAQAETPSGKGDPAPSERDSGSPAAPKVSKKETAKAAALAESAAISPVESPAPGPARASAEPALPKPGPEQLLLAAPPETEKALDPAAPIPAMVADADAPAEPAKALAAEPAQPEPVSKKAREKEPSEVSPEVTPAEKGTSTAPALESVAEVAAEVTVGKSRSGKTREEDSAATPAHEQLLKDGTGEPHDQLSGPAEPESESPEPSLAAKPDESGSAKPKLAKPASEEQAPKEHAAEEKAEAVPPSAQLDASEPAPETAAVAVQEDPQKDAPSPNVASSESPRAVAAVADEAPSEPKTAESKTSEPETLAAESAQSTSEILAAAAESPRHEASPAPEKEAPAPLQPAASGAPGPPVSVRPRSAQPLGAESAPVDSVPTSVPRMLPRRPSLPALELGATPCVIPAQLRKPEAAKPAPVHLNMDSVRIPAEGPEPTALSVVATTTILALVPPPAPEPPLGRLVSSAASVLSRIPAAAPKAADALAPPHEQISIPGPTLPHELTSLDAAGIARILVARPSQTRRSSSWVLSLTVAAAIVAGTLTAAFYAMPTLAGPVTKSVATAPAPVEAPVAPKPAPPTLPDNPSAKLVEVAGVRFVTDLPNHRPEIHYLVVNHTAEPVTNLTVTVTLRSTNADADTPPLSRFSFRTPKLNAYESKEMVSTIEHMNREVSLPDWRLVRAEVEVRQ